MEWEDINILRKKGFSFQKAFEEQNREHLSIDVLSILSSHHNISKDLCNFQ